MQEKSHKILLPTSNSSSTLSRMARKASLLRKRMNNRGSSNNLERQESMQSLSGIETGKSPGELVVCLISSVPQLKLRGSANVG